MPIALLASSGVSYQTGILGRTPGQIEMAWLGRCEGECREGLFLPTVGEVWGLGRG